MNLIQHENDAAHKYNTVDIYAYVMEVSYWKFNTIYLSSNHLI